MKKKKSTPKPRKPSVLDSGNWISESTVGNPALSAPNEADPSPSGSSDSCSHRFIDPCVAKSWTDTQYNAWANLENDCPLNDIHWAIEGDAQGTTMTSPGIFKFGPNGAKITISATCRGHKVTMILVYVKAELLEVEFANAHNKDTKKNILTDEAMSHVKDGQIFNPPFRGWSKMAKQPINFAVAHTFTDEVALNLKVKITPKDLSFSIQGNGLMGAFGGNLIWNAGPQASTGQPQAIPNVNPAGKLPQSAGITKGFISWTVTAACCPGASGTLTTATLPDKSGEHEIFRTFAKPNPPSDIENPKPNDPLIANAQPSLARMRMVCNLAEGQVNRHDAVEQLMYRWPGEQPNPWPENTVADNPFWRIFDGFTGDCLTHATSFCQGCRLLGIYAIPRKIHASTDDDCLVEETWDVEVNGNKEVAKLLFADKVGAVGETGFGPDYNNYQTVGYVIGQYWNVYGGTRVVLPFSCDMFNFLTNPNNGFFVAQYWVISVTVNGVETPQLFSDKDAEFPDLECND